MMHLLCLPVLLLTAPIAAPRPAEEIKMLSPEQFVVLPWSWIKNDAAAIREIKECGMNLAGFVPVEALDTVKDQGMQAIVSWPSAHAGDAECALSEDEISRRIGELAPRLRGHPAVYGVYLRDEPGATAFPGLARWAAAVRKALPGVRPYINLFPNYASPEQMGVATYDQYVAQFLETVKPDFLSYDHYALMDDGTLRTGYFQNLEAARRASLAKGVPFWNIVLANAHFHYAEPTEAGLRFQVYTTLAYGARGISYFTYTTPEVGNYRLAPIDQFGNRTPTWEMLRRVNLQIHRLGPTYVKLKSVGVFHHPNVPEGCSDIKSAKHVAEVSGADLAVGEFENADGTPYALVVNKDLHRSTPFTIRFRDPGQVMLVSAYTGASTPFGGEHGWLAAGQGMLLYLQR